MIVVGIAGGCSTSSGDQPEDHKAMPHCWSLLAVLDALCRQY